MQVTDAVAAVVADLAAGEGEWKKEEEDSSRDAGGGPSRRSRRLGFKHARWRDIADKGDPEGPRGDVVSLTVL